MGEYYSFDQTYQNLVFDVLMQLNFLNNLNKVLFHSNPYIYENACLIMEEYNKY